MDRYTVALLLRKPSFEKGGDEAVASAVTGSVVDGVPQQKLYLASESGWHDDLPGER